MKHRGFSFSFYFLFLFLFSFSFERLHWPSSLGGPLNLLQVVNETRVDFAKKEGARQFLSLLKKTDVRCVWLAKSGRRRLKTMRLQLVIDLIMHGTNLTSIAFSSVSIFQLVGKAKPPKKKKLVQNWARFFS